MTHHPDTNTRYSPWETVFQLRQNMQSVYSFNKYFSSTYYVPDTVVLIEKTIEWWIKQSLFLALWDWYSRGEYGQMNKQLPLVITTTVGEVQGAKTEVQNFRWWPPRLFGSQKDFWKKLCLNWDMKNLFGIEINWGKGGKEEQEVSQRTL